MTHTKIVNLQGKYRKGRYLYVKEKGYPGRHYKIRGSLGIEGYIRYYEDTVIRKVKGKIKDYIETPDIKTATKKMKKITKDVKSKPTLPSLIMPGATTTKIKNINSITDEVYMRAKKELLRPLVNDEQIVNILSSPENFNKLRNRLEAKIHFYNTEGEKLGEIYELGINPMEMVTRVRSKIKPYMTFEEWSEAIKELGYRILNQENVGTFKRADIEITLRKGR